MESIKTTWEYNYDANGNVTLDKNKGLFNIMYNTFNQPVSLSKSDGMRLEYKYDGNGSKLRQDYYIGQTTLSKQTDFISNFVYENGIPIYCNTTEGRMIRKTDGTWFVETYLKDHLGSIRVAFTRENGVNKVRQVDSYYPFGMNIKELSQSSTDNYKPNEYLYNGKMMQDEVGLNLLDYGARFYDAVLGRFHTQDAFAEKYLDFTPYQYGVDNPILYVDINGDSIQATSDAILAIYHALDKNANVHFDVNNGMLDPESFKEQAENSNDIVLKDLYEIASNERTVEISVSNNETYKDSQGNMHSDKFMQPYDFDIKDLGSDIYKQLKAQGEKDGLTIQGNLGSTLLPGNISKSGKQSTNGNIQILINGYGSLNHRAVAVAHEFGHVVLFLRGLPFSHGEKGVDKAVYDRSDIVKKRLGYAY